MTTEKQPAAASKGAKLMRAAAEAAWATEPDATNERNMEIFAIAAIALLNAALARIEKMNTRIAELEATQEPKRAAPIARTAGYFGGRMVIVPTDVSVLLPTGLALYAAPAAPEPLTDAQIQEGRRGWFDFEDAPELWAFSEGVRFAEERHGITAAQQGDKQ